jgi:hypothetical protein
MFRRLSGQTLANLLAILSVLPVVAITVVGATSSILHLVLPAGSHWS